MELSTVKHSFTAKTSVVRYTVQLAILRWVAFKVNVSTCIACGNKNLYKTDELIISTN